MDYIEHAIWPLVVLLLALLVFHNLREQLQPIMSALIGSLAEQAQKSAVRVCIASLFGLSAALAAFYDLFSQVTKTDYNAMSGWQVAALLAKVANPFIVAFLAYVMPPAVTQPSKPLTNPPFTPPPSP